MSKFWDVDQGTTAWFEKRMGIPTASQFHKIVTPGGKLSKSRDDPDKMSKGAIEYMMKLIAERLLKDSMDDQLQIEWMEHGKAEQPHAQQNFEYVNEVKLLPVGFVTTDDGRWGASPDALVEGKREGVEIKCPAPWTHLGYMLEGLGTDYKPQVQGQILVAEFDLVHFYSYHPRMPAKQVTTEPDKPFIKLLRSALEEFSEKLDKYHERARALGAYVESIHPVRTPLELAYPDRDDHEGPIQVVVPDLGNILEAG